MWTSILCDIKQIITRTHLFNVEVLHIIRGFWFYGKNLCLGGLNDLLRISVEFGSMTTSQWHFPVGHISYILKSNRVILLHDSFVKFRSTDSVTLLRRLKQLPTWTVMILAANIYNCIYNCIYSVFTTVYHVYWRIK